jgi:hypothetical protein
VLDANRNGISVAPFLNGRADRELIINQVLALLRQDLQPFSVAVHRASGVVAGVGATTILVGNHTEAHLVNGGFLGYAGDVDFTNNNATDIALAWGFPQWATAPANVVAQGMADLILHEAGHTWGLAHVNAPTTSREAMTRVSVGLNSRFENSYYAMAEYPGYFQNSYLTIRNMFASFRLPANANDRILPSFAANGLTANQLASPGSLVADLQVEMGAMRNFDASSRTWIASSTLVPQTSHGNDPPRFTRPTKANEQPSVFRELLHDEAIESLVAETGFSVRACEWL